MAVLWQRRISWFRESTAICSENLPSDPGLAPRTGPPNRGSSGGREIAGDRETVGDETMVGHIWLSLRRLWWASGHWTT
jgi:hypothetical protein